MPTFDRSGVRVNLSSLIAPRQIAIVGASADTGKHTGRTLANLLRSGYTGEIFPVNPGHKSISGVRCFPSIKDLPRGVDCAYLLLGAGRVGDAVQQCVDQDVRTIVVCGSGFGELGADGLEVQRELRDIARAGGSRILGPNCIGVMNVSDNVIACPTLNITGRLTPGRVSIVSQSGGMGVNVLNRAQGRGIGLRALISSGNECDLEAAELIDALLDDEETASIALLIEQLRDAERFIEVASRARAVGKPLTLLKIGRSDVGGRSVRGHTGAMAGEYAVFRDVIQQLGVLEVGSVDELLDAAYVLASAPIPCGPRLVAVSPSGGECSYVADRAVAGGLTLPELSPATWTALAPDMPLGTPGNPLDPTGQIIGDGALLGRVLDLVADDDAFDMITFAVPTWGQFDAERLLPRFIEAARGVTKPIALSAWSAQDLTETADALLRDSDVLTFPSADQGVDALANLYRYHSARSWDRVSAGPRLVMPAGLRGDHGEYQAKQLLRGWGVTTCTELLTSDTGSAIAFAEQIGWPVVAKLQCPDLNHKSELGLVKTAVSSPDELADVLAEFDTIASAHGLAPEGYLVCQQLSGAEVIVGAVRDPSFGPVVMIGAGGVLAEYFDDRVFRMCPLSVADAMAAIETLRVGAVLMGARGRVYDVRALAELVASVSAGFARSDWLTEVDLNPVIVHEGTGATVVDAVLGLDPSA